jgi:hypothetical protein
MLRLTVTFPFLFKDAVSISSYRKNCFAKSYNVHSSEISFGGTYHLHLQGPRLGEARNSRAGGVKKRYFAWLVLQPRGHMFLRIVRPKNFPLIVTAVRTSDPEQNCLWFMNWERYPVPQLVKAVCYNLEGRGFESRWGGYFANDLIFPAALWPRSRLNL